MCGLVAVITKNRHGFNRDEQIMSHQLLYVDALRGKDATGVITCHNNRDFGIMKEASESSVFNDKYIGSTLDNDLYKNGVALIGHNRAKTIGENKDENAHPFVIDKTFAMVHNGTLRNHKALADTTVDSEALAITFKKAMDEEDFVKGMEDAIDKVNGAFACIWYDQKRNQIGIVRNSQRPLFVVETKDSLILGSELAMLQWIVSRNGCPIIHTEAIAQDVLHLVDVEKGGAVVSKFPLERKPIVTKTMGNGITTTGITKSFLSLIKSSPGTVGCSKNAFKRIRNVIMGKYITFDLDDWVEKSLFGVEGTEYILLGSSVETAYDLCEVRHLIQGVIDISKLDITAKEMDFQTKWIGMVDLCTYDASKSEISIKVVNIMPKKDTFFLEYENKPQTH